MNDRRQIVASGINRSGSGGRWGWIFLPVVASFLAIPVLLGVGFALDVLLRLLGIPPAQLEPWSMPLVLLISGLIILVMLVTNTRVRSRLVHTIVLHRNGRVTFQSESAKQVISARSISKIEGSADEGGRELYFHHRNGRIAVEPTIMELEALVRGLLRHNPALVVDCFWLNTALHRSDSGLWDRARTI